MKGLVPPTQHSQTPTEHKVGSTTIGKGNDNSKRKPNYSVFTRQWKPVGENITIYIIPSINVTIGDVKAGQEGC